MKEFLVEVQVTFPDGESLDDWADLGRFYGDVTEDKIQEGVNKIANEIEMKITKWCAERNLSLETSGEKKLEATND